MDTAVMMGRIAEASPRFKARMAGVFYLLTILMGVVVLLVHGRLRFIADLIATACYVAVAALLYALLKPVNRSLSLLAAFFSLVGLAIGKLYLHPQSEAIEFVFIGFYCLLIGYLIFRSTFLPRILGALMAFAGLGYLTFLSPPLANYLSPYNLASGGIGQVSLNPVAPRDGHER
ncbi:MAG TPA: DUF4386 family protein [Candidatus Angelobacter sp.]